MESRNASLQLLGSHRALRPNVALDQFLTMLVAAMERDAATVEGADHRLASSHPAELVLLLLEHLRRQPRSLVV